MAGPLDLVAAARGELGAHEEPPGSNVTKYGRAVGLTPASWCMQFAYSCWSSAGLPEPPDARAKSSVGFFLDWANAQRWFETDPRPGDLACFIWRPGESWPDHVGIIEDVYGDGSLATIEGNASGPDNVGDEVARHVRPRSWEILAVVRPPYAGGVTPTRNTPPAPPAGRGVAPYPRLSNGVLLDVDSGHHDLVAIYQRRMAERGWPIAVDGLFGPQTRDVTRRFQQQKHLEIDGVVGPQTWTGAFELPVT